MSWEETQVWERGWWGNCTNTLGEQAKQLEYAARMGLHFWHNGKTPYTLPMPGRRVVDLGGGPVSLLLLSTGLERAVVVDPLPMPGWVEWRYQEAGIELVSRPAEEFDETGFDEAWIYNVMQHVQDPEQICRVARRAARLVRVFEWIDTPATAGHPHSLHEAELDRWLGGVGRTTRLSHPQLTGLCYFGIFLGEGLGVAI